MPNDAKLGLVSGVAIVVLIAALFFRKDATAESNAGDASAGNGATIPGMARPTPRDNLPAPPGINPALPGSAPNNSPTLPGVAPPSEANLPPAALPEVPMAGAG